MKTKKVYFYLVVVIVWLTSCQSVRLYDVASPEIVFCNLLANNNLLVQFNEPIKHFQYILADKLESVRIAFPKSNIEIPNSVLMQANVGNIEIFATDTSDNNARYIVESPVINNNPAKLVIDCLQLKYSKKSPQKLTLVSRTGGLISGYKLMMFVGNTFVSLPFDKMSVKAGERITVTFEPCEENVFNRHILNKKQNVLSYNRFRLSSTCSAIFIVDNHDTVIDSIFYIDTKKNDLEYFETKSRAYKRITQYLSDKELDVKCTNVAGNSIRKPVVKQKDKYIVKQ